jgi:PadR family transcriptional regulator, regulatory protein PadR
MTGEGKSPSAQILKGHLDLLLLATLQASPAHGYAIIERLRLQSNGTFDLPEGTIYPALHRLEQAGLLASQWSEEHARRRRVYMLTAKGHAALQSGTQEWLTFAQGIHAILFGEVPSWQS